MSAVEKFIFQYMKFFLAIPPSSISKISRCRGDPIVGRCTRARGIIVFAAVKLYQAKVRFVPRDARESIVGLTRVCEREREIKTEREEEREREERIDS